MIIWINGAFGTGKTSTAHELHKRIKDSYIFDPEHAGFYISQNIPKEMLKDDFQDYPMWRQFNYSMLRHIGVEYEGAIIVPMTIVNLVYYNEIIGRLREDGITVHHFTLLASKETLKKRLRNRGEEENSWAEQQIDRCIQGLSRKLFLQHIDTEELPIERVADQILSRLDISLIR